MKITFDLIAVFTEDQLGLDGNPSVVIETTRPLDETYMKRIARDMNQPATTFIVNDQATRELSMRWFAPDAEIGLCGHGTAAAAAFLSGKYGSGTYHIQGGGQRLRCTADESHFDIALEGIAIQRELPVPEQLCTALGAEVVALFETDNKHIAVVSSAREVKDMKPDFQQLRGLPHFGYAVTAPGDEEQVDFVSRTLVPFVQQLEDHATGSSHAALAPYWARRLRKPVLSAIQLSPRGGFFRCEVHKDGQVGLSGQYRVLARGTYQL